MVRDDPSDEPVAGATADDRRIFAAGDRLFERVFRPSQGLGPEIELHGTALSSGRQSGYAELVLTGVEPMRAAAILERFAAAFPEIRTAEALAAEEAEG